MPGVLWTAAELMESFPGNSQAADVSGVSIDSRTVQPGDLFIALSGDPGPRFGGGDVAGAKDGHDFVTQAVAAGAAAVMAHRRIETTVPVVLVEDTLDGLWTLGAAARQRMHGHCIAVTGSSGKTTLRAWLESVLREFGQTHASTGSLNNHWGVPLSLSRMPAESEFGVFEVGTNHPGEIAPLSELVRPDVAVLLNVLPAHIGNFEDMAALTREKLSICSGLAKGKPFALPASLAAQTQWQHCVTFGFEQEADVRGEMTEAALRVYINGQRFSCHPPFSDAGRCQSVLALYAICHILDLDLQQVSQRVSQLALPEGRGNRLQVGGIMLIDDSYNANPVSMRMALDDLRHQRGGRRIALLGEMRELGDLSAAAHREVMAAARGLDRVLTFGPGFIDAGPDDGAEHFDAVAALDIGEFAASLKPGDTVLIKGANLVFWKTGFVGRLLEALKA